MVDFVGVDGVSGNGGVRTKKLPTLNIFKTNLCLMWTLPLGLLLSSSSFWSI